MSDESGSISMKKIKNAPLQKSDLDTNDVFIIDARDEIFVWVGKGANRVSLNLTEKYSFDVEFLLNF